MPLPAIGSPMLATLIDEPFDDRAWLFETKWDGVRALCTVLENGRVSMISRNGHDLLGQFPEFAGLGHVFGGLPAVFDGEIISLDDRGLSSFQRLQARLNRQRPGSALVRSVPTKFEVFDMLCAKGKDVRSLTLDERKALLRKALPRSSRVRFSAFRVGAGRAMFERAKRLGWEGIIGKRRASAYRSGRSREWVKIKTVLEQEFVIGGWTDPRGSRAHFGSLLLGYYDAAGALQYAGQVGTGFNEALLDALSAKLAGLATSRCPYAGAPNTRERAHWVRPQLVAEIKFGEWTRDGSLRQPVFLGLRADKKPKDVGRERPAHSGERA